jgi:HJR/Mrr/RecB family endonuclease
MLRIRGRDAEPIAACHPTRVLAECAAKQEIVAIGDEKVQRILAAAYAEHPGFPEEWRA